MPNCDVTVIVCSYNRADSLKNALGSLTDLETDGRFTYEVLVIDNASTDHTQEVVEQVAQDSACPVRCELESQPGVSFARNCGVQKSNTPWVAFFDDDQLAEPDWLLRLYEATEEKQVKCVGGAVHLRLLGGEERSLKPWVKVMFSCTKDMTIAKYYDRKWTPGAGNLLVHRSVFDEIGLFRTDLVEGGEDTELYHRMRRSGFEAWYTPRAVVHHLVPQFRLEPKYLRLASKRMGEHVTRREFEEYGKWKFVFVAVARLFQTLFLYGGRLLVALVSGDQEVILERKCRWWLGVGYLRAAFRFLFRKPESTSSLEFRNEREPASS